MPRNEDDAAGEVIQLLNGMANLNITKKKKKSRRKNKKRKINNILEDPAAMEKYQDTRLFGIFSCPDCKRRWMSSSAWLEFEQKCNHCNIYTLAIDLRLLNKSHGMNRCNPNKQHPTELCGKCENEGINCRTIRNRSLSDSE